MNTAINYVDLRPCESRIRKEKQNLGILCFANLIN